MASQANATASRYSSVTDDSAFTVLRRNLRLIGVLARREIEGRYRGSVLGLLWSFLTPLFMLAIYTFVFGTVFQSKWVTSAADASPAEFAVILFTGLIVYQIFSEPVNRAPTLILGNVSYVKKVVFPVHILVPVSLCTALFHAVVSFLMLLPFVYLVMGTIPLTALLMPLTIAPLMILVLGVSWFLASLGTYIRDIGQFVGTVVTAVLFLAPIFFPLTALPVWLRPWLVLNPLTIPVQQTREVLIFGQIPDFAALGLYTLVASVVFMAGYFWFQKTRKGFADVL